MRSTNRPPTSTRESPAPKFHLPKYTQCPFIPFEGFPGDEPPAVAGFFSRCTDPIYAGTRVRVPDAKSMARRPAKRENL